MLKFILGGAVKNAIRGTLAALAAFLLTVNVTPVPDNQVTAMVWTYAVVPLITAAASALQRWVAYDPRKS